MSLFGDSIPSSPGRGRSSTLRAPFAWYGGKAYYADWIISNFPSHRVYVEPFGGAANVLIRKPHAEVEVFNDLDRRVVNFFRVLRDESKFEKLVRLATLTPYSREEFGEVATTAEPEDEVERAWWFFTRCRQSLGGLGMSNLTRGSWAMSLRTRRNMAEPVSKYLSAIDGLPDLASRFRTVAIENLPAVDLITKYDGPDVFFYCDPPYVPETRYGAQASTYGHEMTEEQHIELLDALVKCEGAVMLSGYASKLYDSRLSAWRREEMEATSHLANSGQKRVEVIWMNYR